MQPDEPLYRKAFRDYLRHGTPPALTLKQSRPTTHYVWRTKQDLLVRGSHAANDGKLFAWTARPATGHPGEDFGCRCVVEPFVPGVTEYVEIRLSGVNDTGREWSSEDFYDHYRFGNGQGVALRQVGHLEKVVDRYMMLARERLKGQIADEARKNPVGFFRYPFG